MSDILKLDIPQKEITLLDLFAAMAPEEPPAWFEAELPPRPPFQKENPLFAAIVTAYTNDGESDWSPEVRPYKNPKNGIFETPTLKEEEEAKVYYKKSMLEHAAHKEWNDNWLRARIVQWPYAWARFQLQERQRLMSIAWSQSPDRPMSGEVPHDEK